MTAAHLPLALASLLTASSAGGAPHPPEENGAEGPRATERPEKGLDARALASRAPDAQRSIFTSRAYRFCHDPEFGAGGTLGVEFCPMFDASTDDVCPEARASCPSWTWPPHLERGHERRRAIDLAPPLSLPELPQALAQILLGGLAVILAVAAARALRGARVKGRGLESGAEEGVSWAMSELPEAQAQALFRQARASLGKGDGPRAATLLHLGLLRHLDDAGRIRFHPSRTNGEYARGLRGDPRLQELFQSSARQTERLRFGDGLVHLDEIVRLLDAAEPLVEASAPTGKRRPSGSAALPLLLFLSPFGGLGVGCSSEEAPAYHFRGPTGLSALPAMLEALDIPVEVAADLDFERPRDVGLVVLRTAALPPRLEEEPGLLARWIDLGIDVLVIDDGWLAPERFPVDAEILPPGGVDRLLPPRLGHEAACEGALTAVLDRWSEQAVLVPRARRLKARASLPAESPLLGAPVLAHPLLVAEGGGVDAAAVGLCILRVSIQGERLEGGGVYLFSDRDLFTNASLTRPSNAAAVAALFSALLVEGQRVLLVDDFDGYAPWASRGSSRQADATNPFRALRASKLLPFLLQLFATLLLLFGFLGAAFGPLRDPVRRDRKRFVAHVDALGRRYGQAGVLGRRYAAKLLSRWLQHRYRGRARGRNLSELARDLAEEHRLRQQDVEAALAFSRHDDGSEEGDPRKEILHALSVLAGVSTRRGLL